jgi:hypothetical protein
MMTARLSFSLISLLGLALAPAAHAATAPQEPATESAKPAPKPEEKADEQAEPADEDEGPAPIVIRHGNVQIGTGAVLRRATVVIEDGKITAVGHDVDVPEDATEIDATGMVVAPGFVIPLIQNGFGIPRRIGDGVADELNPFDPQVKMALAAGITSVLATGDGGSKTPSGTSLLVKMRPDSPEGMATDLTDTVVSMRVPLTPKDMRDFEELLEKTREYLREKEKAREQKPEEKAEEQAKDGEGKTEGQPDRGRRQRRGGRGRQANGQGDGPKPPKGGEQLARVLEGEARLWIAGRGSAMDDSDLRQALEIASMLGVGVVLDRPFTAWVDPEPIARTGSMVLLNPREQQQPDPARPDETGSNLASGAILHGAGVPFAVTCPGGWFGGQNLGTNGLLGQDLHTPFVDAAYAIRGGLPARAGLRTLTIDAAQLAGVEARVGSIEVGKDADILLLDGDPLHYKTFVQTAIVDGRIVYEKAEEPFYSHITR